MAEEIQGLIDKINQEGIRLAQEKADEITGRAQKEAAEIVERARQEAEAIVFQAQEKAMRAQEKGKTLLSQAGRDLLLSLRKEINAILKRLIITEVRQALGPDALSGALLELIKGSAGTEKAGIVITLGQEDLEVLNKNLLPKLKDAIRKGITLRPSEEISGGFTISYDAGKSEYDFTDAALAEYIGAYLKPKLDQILKDALSVND